MLVMVQYFAKLNQGRSAKHLTKIKHQPKLPQRSSSSFVIMLMLKSNVEVLVLNASIALNTGDTTTTGKGRCEEKAILRRCRTIYVETTKLHLLLTSYLLR